MMILCRTFHSLLGFPDPYPSRRVRYAPPPDAAGGLRFLADGPPNDRRRVVDSSSVGPTPPLRETIPDPGSWGLHEVAGGIGLCTENLGSESCCDDVAAAAEEEELGTRSPRRGRRSSRRSRTEQRKRSFPPPLPWLLESNGRRNRFMKGERRDGRFLLREVRIERPEVLRAERQDGRLRLHLIESEEEVEEEVAEEVPEVEEKWEVVGPVGTRCQEEVSGNGSKCMQLWWGHHHQHHRFVTTA
ncbi:putative proline-rich receptor-like protein kinase PERK13 [Iris pallida]|uniref:Proline-rich receptor-like protein kinase PERK13 n=1 Tax=Iris pallida TaxID=29817 RepID=A0AAX6FL34_IRIPA|nr:putative proline-rich receptor-like protein kinase PERK13 [Iris pallida]